MSGRVHFINIGMTGYIIGSRGIFGLRLFNHFIVDE